MVLREGNKGWKDFMLFEEQWEVTIQDRSVKWRLNGEEGRQLPNDGDTESKETKEGHSSCDLNCPEQFFYRFLR